MVPWTRSRGVKRKRLEYQRKMEGPGPTVLPLETLSLPGLALKSSAFGFRILIMISQDWLLFTRVRDATRSGGETQGTGQHAAAGP